MAVMISPPIVDIIGAHEILEHETLSDDQNSMKFLDQFQDLRLDMIDMSYKDLLALEELLASNKLKRVFGTMFYLSQLHFILISFCSLKTFLHILGLNYEKTLDPNYAKTLDPKCFFMLCQLIDF